MVKIFGKDIRTELITSGDFLTPQITADLYAAGISQILVSLYDGPHQIEHFNEIFTEAKIPESHYFLQRSLVQHG